MLKLREPRNAYELLGLPRSATAEKIRARYGRLVRNYRRERSPRELLEDEQFRRWTNAYLLLLGPERREYDRRLRAKRGREEAPDAVAGLPEAGRVLLEARVAFLQRKLNDAVETGKEAVKRDSRNAEGYALLGEALQEQGKYREALTMFNYAIQFDPDNRGYWQQLQEVTALGEGKALPRRYRRERTTPLNRPVWAWVLVVGALAAVGGGMLYLRQDWGPGGLFNLSTKLIYAAVADGFLMGLALAATSMLMPLDDEMLSYQVSGFGVEMTPVGIYVAFPGIVFFWATPAFYAIVAYLDDHVSLSIVISLCVCGLLAAGFGYLAPRESRVATFLLGGNFVYFGFLWGWLLGSIRRRVFEH